MEEWRKIDGYDNYFVSNTGRVKTTDFNHTGKEKEISTFINFSGYVACNLMERGVRKRKLVHRLVAFAFNRDSWFHGATVNHEDLNKQNNNWSNLTWTTTQENTKHAHRNKAIRYAKGETHYKAKLTTIQVCEVRKLLNENVNSCAIARLLNVKPSTIYGIKYKKSRINEQTA